MSTEEGDATGPPDAPPIRKRRRRPGRLRRWVLRPLLWSLAALVVLIFVLQQLLDTRWARDGARELIVEKLTAALGRNVQLVDLSFELLPLSVEIWGFSIDGPDPQGPRFIEIPWAAVDADLAALKSRRLHLREVRVQRPIVYLEFYPDKTHNMLKRRGGPRKPRRFDIFVDRLEIDRADFGLDQQTVQLSLAADSIRARMRGVGEMHLSGQLDAHNVVVRLPNAGPLTVAVSARGALRRGLIEVESARISGPDISITSTGACEYPPDARERRNCLFQARGRARGEQLAEIGYFPDLRGAFTFDGSLAWRPDLTGWRSRIQAEDIEIWDRRIQGFDGSLAADRFGLRIGVDEAGYAGGSLSGEVAWEAKVDGKPWTTDLAFRGLSLDSVLADQNIPSTGYASRLDGHFEYRFVTGLSERGQGRAELEMVPATDLPGLPLAGAFPLRIEDGIVRTESVSLHSERQSVLAGGWYDLATDAGAFDYEINSADLAELTPLLPLDPEAEPPLWLPTNGRGDLEGTLFLEPEDPATPRAVATRGDGSIVDRPITGTCVDLRMRLEEVVSPSVAVQQATGSMWLTTDTATSLRLELGDEDEALLMRGEMPYLPTREQPIDLTFDAFNWPLEAVRPWLDFVLPVDGLISGRLDLLVDDVASSGELEARVAPAILTLSSSLEAVPESLLADVDSLAGRLSWDAHQIRFDHLDLVAVSGTMRGAGTHDWTTGALDLELSSPSLRLEREPLNRFLPRADIRGEVAVSGRLGGWLHEPQLELVIEADSLALGQKVLTGRPSRLEVLWGDGQLQADGRLLDMVTIEGGGALADRRADLAFRIDGSDLRGLAELLLEEPPTDFDGSFQGSLNIHGDDERPPTVDLLLTEVEIALRDRSLKSLEPVRARLEAEHLTVNSLYLAEPATATAFFLSGTIDYQTPAILDLNLESTVSGHWLELLDLGFDVDGSLDLLGKVGGTSEQPTFTGQGELTGGWVDLSADLPLELTDLHGILSFQPGEVVLERLEGHLGRGQVALEGEATLVGADQPLVYRVQLTGTDLDLRYLEGWSVRGETQLTLRSIDGGHLLDGRAHLASLEYGEDIRADFAQLMRGFLQRQRLEMAPRDSLLSVVELNIDVEAPDAVKVRNNLADLTGSANLLIRGNMAQPVLYGEVDLDPEGTLIYNSTDYEIERGRIVFANPYELDPEIDLVAVTRVREFDVTLAVDGTFDRLETRFSSEPPLPDLEVFRLLASGGDAATDSALLEPQRTEVEEDPSTSAATFLYGQAASVIGQRVNTLFGFDKFRIDPLTGSGDQLSKARVTVGKRLSKDLLVTFSADPSSTEDQRLRIEWQVSPGLVLVLTQNGDDSYSTDARWESSF